MSRTISPCVLLLLAGCGLMSLVCCLFLSCATTGKEFRLDLESEEFLNEARYIISREESRMFLELPPASRSRFIVEFWQRRDPTPDTEENEFRDTYYQRIDEANRIFRGGRPGWLQDRGRIYILFGPPDERQTNPMGGRPIDAYEDPREMVSGRRVATGEKPTEIWVYHNLAALLGRTKTIRLVFVDTQGTGDYSLATNLGEVIPGGIDALLQPNLAFFHELHKEEGRRTRLSAESMLFDFSWALLKEKNKELGSNLSVEIVLPYKKIIFLEEEGRLQAMLEFTVRVQDTGENTLWEHKKNYNLAFTPQEIERRKEDSWLIKVPVLRWLEKGRYFIYISLENTSGDQVGEKLLPVKI